MTIKTKQVFSSHVDTVAYDDAAKTLLVEYKGGKTSAYSGVSPDVANAVMSAESIGSALHEHVRGKFPHTYVGA